MKGVLYSFIKNMTFKADLYLNEMQPIYVVTSYEYFDDNSIKEETIYSYKNNKNYRKQTLHNERVKFLHK